MSLARDGYAIARSVVSQRQVTILREAVVSLVTRWREGETAVRDGSVPLSELTSNSPLRNPGISPDDVADEPFIIGDLLAHDARFLNLLEVQRLWELAAESIGVPLEQVIFHMSNLTRKPAHTGPAIAWHRDSSNRYFRPEDGRFVRLLIPLSEMSEYNGGTGVIPGSHMDDDPAVLQRCRAGDLSDVIWPILQPGEVLVTHPELLHGGLPNRSDSGRDLLVLQFGVKDALLRECTTEVGSLYTFEEMRQLIHRHPRLVRGSARMPAQGGHDGLRK